MLFTTFHSTIELRLLIRVAHRRSCFPPPQISTIAHLLGVARAITQAAAIAAMPADVVVRLHRGPKIGSATEQ
jgi:hypothetical protein